jgi:hypothetical protein
MNNNNISNSDVEHENGNQQQQRIMGMEEKSLARGMTGFLR